MSHVMIRAEWNTERILMGSPSRGVAENPLPIGRCADKLALLGDVPKVAFNPDSVRVLATAAVTGSGEATLSTSSRTRTVAGVVFAKEDGEG